MEEIVRFAPSPTGYLHIGSLRTALYNYYFAHRYKGKFLLRIEDTDLVRSTLAAIDAIINSLKWMNVAYDPEVILQSKRIERHKEVAYAMLDRGGAYLCYISQEEIAQQRDAAINAGKPFKFHSKWRDNLANEAPPAGVKPVIRLKVNAGNTTVVNDLILGETTVHNNELDDMVLLRSDGTPTYMLAVVVDDHDSGVTTVIRGMDHFTNTFRQIQIYQAMGWDIPKFAHIPLIYGDDGTKLSKRHGALGVEAYRDMGYLPEALENYLLRLGWSHGDDEIISREQAIEWFNLEAVGKSPARFDLNKLNSVNAHYLRAKDNQQLLTLLQNFLDLSDPIFKERVLAGMDGLKKRANTLVELASGAKIYNEKMVPLDAKSLEILNSGGRELLPKITEFLGVTASWELVEIEEAFKEFAILYGLKPSFIAQCLRASVLGTFAAPNIYEVIQILGREEVIKRISEGITSPNQNKE